MNCARTTCFQTRTIHVIDVSASIIKRSLIITQIVYKVCRWIACGSRTQTYYEQSFSSIRHSCLVDLQPLLPRGLSVFTALRPCPCLGLPQSQHLQIARIVSMILQPQRSLSALRTSQGVISLIPRSSLMYVESCLIFY